MKLWKWSNQNLSESVENVNLMIAESEMPIRSYNFENIYENVFDTLMFCAMTYLGIQPNEQFKLVLIESIEFVKKNYQHIGIKEIKLAFELATTKKIDVNITPYYGTFSILMLSDVLSTYTRYRNKVMQNISFENENKGLSDEEKEKKNLQSRKEALEKMNYAKDQYKKGIIVFNSLDEIPAHYGRILKDYGQINYSSEIKESLYKKAKELHIRDLNMQKMNPNEYKVNEIRFALKKIQDGIYDDSFKLACERIYSKLYVYYYITE